MTQLLSVDQKQVTKKLIRLRKGEGKEIKFNPQAGQVVLKAQTGLQLLYVKAEESAAFELEVPVPAPLAYEGSIYVEATAAGHNSARLVHLLPEGTPDAELVIETYDLQVRLSVDSNRDGIISELDIGRANWVYGKAEQGAVLLINNDRDISDRMPSPGQFSEWSELRIEPLGIDELPPELSLVLQLPPQIAECCAIYRQDEAGEFHHILGKNLQDAAAPVIATSPPLPTNGVNCFIEAHQYPGDLFEGLITLKLLVKSEEETIASDRALYRVAPWMMTPNTLIPAEVYACEMEDNADFLADLKSALDELQIPLTLIPAQSHRGDRWIQDEIEFGYVQGAAHSIPVVFDSPRDRELDDYPEINLLGPDFGHFQIGNNSSNSLDSFGNLEVSPPVAANGRHYPFGRIVVGGRRRGDYSEQSRQMMPELRHFLYAQKIQAPFELYTDWLAVGHVDEIISFVPADNNKGFQVLIASPQNAHTILTRLADRGYADAIMFEGMKRVDYRLPPDQYKSAEITIRELLDDTAFWEANQRYQSYLDLNIQILRQELDINGHHLVNIPVLFHPPFEDGRTAAYFPNMINHLVLENTSLVPQPKGPMINGKCAFESAFEQAVPERNVRFIENWYAYHEQMGEVHCGTNTRRHPFPNEHWWNYKPEGGFDI
ncbi:MAG: protein-arginine deiminase family protein [Phormidesmis sp.]